MSGTSTSYCWWFDWEFPRRLRPAADWHLAAARSGSVPENRAQMALAGALARRAGFTHSGARTGMPQRDGVDPVTITGCWLHRLDDHADMYPSGSVSPKSRPRSSLIDQCDYCEIVDYSRRRAFQKACVRYGDEENPNSMPMLILTDSLSLHTDAIAQAEQFITFEVKTVRLYTFKGGSFSFEHEQAEQIKSLLEKEGILKEGWPKEQSDF